MSDILKRLERKISGTDHDVDGDLVDMLNDAYDAIEAQAKRIEEWAELCGRLQVGRDDYSAALARIVDLETALNKLAYPSIDIPKKLTPDKDEVNELIWVTWGDIRQVRKVLGEKND